MKSKTLGLFTSSLFEHARVHPEIVTEASSRQDNEVCVQKSGNGRYPKPVVGYRADKQSHESVSDSFERYVPRSIRFPGSHPHPTALVESIALAGLIPPEPSYRPILAPYLVENGAVSEAQLEALALMGEAHSKYIDVPYEREPSVCVTSRVGFMLGDGAGVGKGRTIAAAIVDQRNQGNVTALWVSQTDHLYQSTLRDLKALGADSAPTSKINKWKIGTEMSFENGVIFSTYASLRGRRKVLDADGKQKVDDDGNKVYVSRVDQIVQQLGADFSGLVIFDESQGLARAVETKNDFFTGNSQSLQAQTAIELQERLPKARVVYASATALDRVEALAYAPRLGLWGPSTAFATRGAFISAMTAGRKTALEIVCRSLKEDGLYVSRQVSYDGVLHETLVHRMTPTQHEHMRNFNVAWRAVTLGVERALQSVGATEEPTGGSRIGRTKASDYVERVHSKLESAKQRFYVQALTAMQMPSVIPFMQDRLAENECNVVQITNTYEAYLEKSLAAAAKNGDNDLSGIDRSCTAELLDFVKNDFPSRNVMVVTSEDGTTTEEFAIDNLTGLPVENATAVSIKQKVLAAISGLIPVEAPLDTILRQFGEENVAEVTGRSHRVIVDALGRPRLERRSKSASGRDITAFNDGSKKNLIFSNAGGVGEDYASNTGYKNRARRNHYVLQVPSRAVDAMQGIGRTHRTAQTVPPRLIICTTDYPAQIRFISPLARRIGDLGSLTRGDRTAASGNAYRDVVDVEGPYAQKALRRVIKEITDGNVDGVDATVLYEQTGIDAVAVKNSYLPKKERGEHKAVQHLTIKTFLNRMMTADVDEDGGIQGRIIDLLLETMNQLIEDDKAAGVLDEGTQTLTPLSLKIVETNDLSEISRAAEGVFYSRMVREDKDALLSFGSASAMLKTHKNFHPEDRVSGWYESYDGSGASVQIWDSQSKRFTIHRPDEPVTNRINDNRWYRTSEYSAETSWKQRIATHGDVLVTEIGVVHGRLLRVWDGLYQANDRPKAASMTADDGTKIIGCVLTKREVSRFTNWLLASAGTH